MLAMTQCAVQLVTEIYHLCSTHKILGCVTLSKKDHTCAQIRELACTRLVLPQVYMARGTVCIVMNVHAE